MTPRAPPDGYAIFPIEPMNIIPPLFSHLHLVRALQLALREGEREQFNDDRHPDDAHAPSVGAESDVREGGVDQLQQEFDRQGQEAEPPVPGVRRGRDRVGAAGRGDGGRVRDGVRIEIGERHRGEDVLERIDVLEEGRRVDDGGRELARRLRRRCQRPSGGGRRRRGERRGHGRRGGRNY